MVPEKFASEINTELRGACCWMEMASLVMKVWAEAARVVEFYLKNKK
jgi:hypothetical protein